MEQDLPGRGARTVHAERPVVVLQNQADCDDLTIPAVMAAMGSHHTDKARDSDLVLPKGSAGLPQPTVLILGQVFPILKADLQQGRKCGSLSAEELENVRAVLARNFGMV